MRLSPIDPLLSVAVMWTVLLTTGPATAVYVHLGRWTERLAGAVFIAFGARLVWERT